MNNEHFIVKHYTEEEGPTLKGNGFDGLRVGEDREDAEEFVNWLNARLDLLNRLLKQVHLDDANQQSVEEAARHVGHEGESGGAGSASITLSPDGTQAGRWVRGFPV